MNPAETIRVHPNQLPWRCFHCDGIFYSEGKAREHFGADQGSTPACQIKASEGGLLRALRHAEAAALEANDALHAESADGLHAWRDAQSRLEDALRSVEETGFERGIRDQRATVERLRRIVHHYGDRVAMATSARPDWQIEIDEAMSFVADNPEPAE